MLTDTHCHLFYEQIKNDLDAVLARAKDLGVDRFICVATNLEDAEECLNLSKKYKNIYASVGIHPHDSKNAPRDYIKRIYDFMMNDEIVAVGEMGLDYFRNISSPKIQKEIFRSQMRIAKDLNMPVIFHNRGFGITPMEIFSDLETFWWVALFWVPAIFASEKPRIERTYTPWFFMGMASYMIAFAIWLQGQPNNPSIFTEQMCNPDSLIQPHAIWHLLTAYATWCFFMFFRTEKQVS